MAKSISRTEKRAAGRPATNPTSIHLTLTPEPLAEVDQWIERQKEPDLSRPEAIRQLIEIGLRADRQSIQDLNEAKSHADKAKKLAAELGLKVKVQP